jgi:hypothetical protein
MSRLKGLKVLVRLKECTGKKCNENAEGNGEKCDRGHAGCHRTSKVKLREVAELEYSL